jgi:hypothetical protein
VVIQAASIALAVFGLLKWVDDGHSYTKAVNDDEAKGVTDKVGFDIHNIGAMVIVVLALALLVVAFLAKIPGGAKWAGFVLLAVVLQWVFAFASFAAPVVGVLHGGNAIAIAWLGWRAAKQADVGTTAPEAAAVA